MDERKPVAVVIAEVKAALARTVNQVSQQSELSPSLIVTILDSVKAQYMENVVIEFGMLYDNASEKQGEE